MRALLQRCLSASVEDQQLRKQTIDKGLVVFLGVGKLDSQDDADKLVRRIPLLRLFDGEVSKFDKSLIDVQGDVLIVSQFTLYANLSKGRRPEFLSTAPPDKAKYLYEYFCENFTSHYEGTCQYTPFGSRLVLDVRNWGPFSINIDTA